MKKERRTPTEAETNETIVIKAAKASPDSTKEMMFLRNILLDHRGKDNSITSEDIAKMLNISDGDTHNVVRSMIKRCIYLYHLPVAAHRFGYYVMLTNDELRAYSHNLQARADEILDRKEKIEEFFNELYENEAYER